MVIWRIQRPEAAHREQAAAAQNAQQARNGATPAADNIENADQPATTTNVSALGGILPVANTTTRPAAHTVQDERREDALLYYRFCKS